MSANLFFSTKIRNDKLLSCCMFCLVSFWVVLKELVFPWGNEGSKTKPINTHWSVASLGYWQGMRGVRADRTSVRASLSGSRSILQCQECRSALLYVTVPLFVFSWEVRARVNVRRGCPSRLSLGPVQGARVQLTLAIHRLVSAGEGGSNELFCSGALGRNGGTVV